MSIQCEWGKITVTQDSKRSFKDARVGHGWCEEWDWSEYGTNHHPGITLAEVKGIVGPTTRVVILSSGVLGKLNHTQEALDWLQKKNLTVVRGLTPDVVKYYNSIAGEGVVALFHSTC